MDLGRLGSSVRVEEVYSGCFHHNESTIIWTVDGDEFSDGERRVPRSAVEKLRRVVWESREEEDLLDQYEQEITGDVVREKLRVEVPWVPWAPSDAEVRGELRAALNGSPSNTTSVVLTRVLVGGEPEMEFWLHRSYIHHHALPRNCGLPEWNVRLGEELWATRSPRIAIALAPFTKDSAAFDDIVHWPDGYMEMLAERTTRDYAQRYIVDYVGNTLSGDFEVDAPSPAKHFYLGESEDYLLKTRRSEYVSKVRIPMSHLQDPRPMLDAIPGALADAERRIAETTWLRLATRGKEVTLLPNTDGSAYFLEFPGYSDITVRALVLESEEDVLVSNPTRSIVSLVKLQPSKRQTTTLRISPDGSAVFVD